MSSDSNKTQQWITYVTALASIATIIGVIIAYLAYVHPISPQGPSSPDSTPSVGIANPTIPNPNSTTSAPTQPSSQVSSSVDLTGATSTINTFCEFLNSGAIQQAYNLTSSNYQNQHGIDQFTNQFNNTDLIHGGCVYNHPTVSSSNVVVSLTMNRIDPSNGTTSSTNYTATLVRDPQSASWVIDSIQ